jgi:DNA-binding LytR/AlgR family response regulator
MWVQLPPYRNRNTLLRILFPHLRCTGSSTVRRLAAEFLTSPSMALRNCGSVCTIIFVAVEEIASVTADWELLRITTLSGERHVITYRLKDLAARLDDTQFIQLSRSALVNVNAIVTVSPSSGGTYVVTLKNRQTLGVSRIHARALRDTLLRL